MRTLIVRDAMRIPIGRQGENEAQRVVWPDIVTGWAKLYGDGVFSLAVKRKGDAAPYPVTITTENGALVWVPTNADTAVAGSGSCELSYTVDDVLAKSQTWSTEVYSSLTGEGETEPPEPYQSWVDQVVAVGAAAQASADAAKADADRATALAVEVAEKAAQTAQDASDAAKAMEAAQTAQRLAEAAQKAAETAKQAAETAQSAANKSATDADGAKQAAETALKSAQDAAAAAAKAMADIRTLYQEMQTWAQGVIQTVNAAADSADQSATSAAGSASAASEAQSAAETAQRGAEEAKTKAEASKEASAKSEAAAKLSEQNSKASEDAAKASEDNAAGSASAAADSATAAQAAQSGAEAAQSAAEQSAQQAAESAALYDDVVADVNQLKQDVAAITPDDATVNGKPWTSKKIVDSLCMPFEESGNPVQCYPVENYPLGVKVSWEPVQAGSGDPSQDNIRPITGRDTVSVTRCGENLLPFGERIENIYEKQIMAPDALRPLSNAFAGKKLTLTFTLETQNIVFKDNVEEEWRKRIGFQCNGTLADGKKVYELQCWITDINGELTKDGKKTVTATTIMPDLASGEIRFYAQNIISGSFVAYDFGIYAGTTAPAIYEPYTGDTYNIALPETVYGGTLDVESGVVTVEYGHIASYAGEALPGEWISDRDVYSAGAVPTTGAQVVYKLTEPITIQLTPQQIAALSGTNTIYTDADGVIVTGAEDPKHTITELKNAIISLGGNI